MFISQQQCVWSWTTKRCSPICNHNSNVVGRSTAIPIVRGTHFTFVLAHIQPVLLNRGGGAAYAASEGGAASRRNWHHCQRRYVCVCVWIPWRLFWARNEIVRNFIFE